MSGIESVAIRGREWKKVLTDSHGKSEVVNLDG